jgi:bacteriorhodopsin
MHIQRLGAYSWLLATPLFLAQVDLGVGVGGMERVAVFPLPIWTVAVAVRLTRFGVVQSVAK